MNELYINSYCHIHSSKIFKDGEMIHNLKVAGTEDVLKSSYPLIMHNYPKYYKMDALSKLGILGAELLFADIALVNHFSKDHFAIVMSNCDSSLDTDLKHQQAFENMDTFFPSPAIFVYTLPNIVAGEIAIKHQLKGENLFYISNEFDAVQTQMLVENIFSKAHTSACLVGWVNVLKNDYEGFLMLVSPLPIGKNVLLGEANLNTLYKNR